MDKEYHKRQASKFGKEGDCYIHTEMKDGKHPQTMLAGDAQAILWGINAELERIAELVGVTFKDAIGMLMALNHYEYVNAKGDSHPNRFIEGEDWQEEWIANKESEYDKKWDKKVKKFEGKIKEFESKLLSAETMVKNLKQNYESKIFVLNNEKKELQKTIDTLEHRLKEMELGRLLPHEIKETDG